MSLQRLGDSWLILLTAIALSTFSGCAQRQDADTATGQANGTQAVAESETAHELSKELTDILISAEELESRLGEDHLRILDGRSQEAYEAGHIPGAVRVDVNGWKSLALKNDGLRDIDSWSQLVGGLGIDRARRVVVYSDKPTDATRVWWTLKYLGVENAAVLDGGWQYWTEVDGRVSTETPTIDAIAFRPKFQSDRLAEKDELKDSIDGGEVTVVDARSTVEYEGTGGPGERRGRIPGSVHLEWKDLLQDDGRFKPAEELRTIFEAHNISPGRRAVTYCQSGGRASLDAFALELAGYENVQNYYCSWQEWSADDSAPIEK